MQGKNENNGIVAKK